MKTEIDEIKDLICQVQEQLAKLEGKQEFKDGDVITFRIISKYIGIYKNKKEYHAICFEDGGLISEEYNFAIKNEEGHSPATPEEAQMLFDALAKYGKRWNAETKQIEKLRWRAEKGGIYWNMDHFFKAVKNCEDNHISDTARYNAGNYFQTAADCQAFSDKVKELANKQ